MAAEILKLLCTIWRSEETLNENYFSAIFICYFLLLKPVFFINTLWVSTANGK